MMKKHDAAQKGAAAYENEDDPAAAAYYDESIALGLIESEMLPEVLFRCGVSFAKLDEKKSFDLLKRAAELGHVKAMLNLAVCYQKGAGASKNEKECYKWALAAADAGDIEAMYICALCSEQGFGTRKTRRRPLPASSVLPRPEWSTPCTKPHSTMTAARAHSATRRRRSSGSKRCRDGASRRSARPCRVLRKRRGHAGRSRGGLPLDEALGGKRQCRRHASCRRLLL